MLIVPLRGPLHPPPYPADCVPQLRAMLAPLLRHEPIAVRKVAAGFIDGVVTLRHPLIYESRHDSVWFENSQGEASYFVQGPGGIVQRPTGDARHEWVEGLVADGVASVVISTSRNLRGVAPAFVRRGGVRNNLFGFRIPQHYKRPMVARVKLIALDGRVLANFSYVLTGNYLPPDSL